MSDEHFDAVIAALAPFPDGAALQAILQALKEPPPDRTLSRWLSALVSQGAVVQSGAGRAVRYALSPAARQALSSQGAAASPPPAPTPSPATAGGASDPDFPAMLAMAAPMIVMNAMDKAKADLLLRSHAARNRKDPAAYLAYAHNALASLTPAALEPDGITADQFANWRKFYPAAAQSKPV